MKTIIFSSLLACLLFTAIAESQDFGTLEKLKSRQPSRRLLPMHPSLDRHFEGKMISEKSPEALAQGGKFTDERLTTYQHRPPAPQIPKGSIPTKVELTDSVREAWVRFYGSGLAPAEDFAFAVAVDGSGNVHVTGYSTDTTSLADYVTIKYNAAGVLQWVARYNGPENSDDRATAIAVDGLGNVYVTGYSYDASGTYSDYVTIKYDANGNQLWITRYNGPGNYDDRATALAVDGSGNVYVTGSSWGSGTYDDYATIKYDASGNQLWIARYNGPLNYDDCATSLAVDGSGNVYVTGFSYSSWTYYDYATIKYDANGNQLWIARYIGNATALVVDGSGNVYVTGSNSHYNWSVFTTIKYTQGPTSVQEEKRVPESFALLQNYPNPFNPSTNIKFDLPTGQAGISGLGLVSLKVFNILGQEVATLVNEALRPGSYEVTFNATGLASGVYFYRLVAGSFTETKKLVLLR